MADFVRFLWLDGGAIPIFPFVGTLYHMAGGEDDKWNPKLRWHKAGFPRTAFIPLICTSLEDFLSFMQEQHEVDGETLYVAIRGFSRYDSVDGPINSLIIAAAIVPGTIEGSVEYPWRYEPLGFLNNFCTLSELETAPTDPLLLPLLPLWERMATSREEYEKHRMAQDRAKNLLESHLDEAQLEEFKSRHRFRVRDEDGLVYLITYESHGNVWRVAEKEDGNVIPLINYCYVLVDGDIPIYDQMLAQKLLIEGDFDDFKAAANTTIVDPTPDPTPRGTLEERFRHILDEAVEPDLV